MMKKSNDLDYQKFLSNRFLSEANEEKQEEQKDQDTAKNVKNPKGKIISGLEGMRPGAMMQAIAKSLGKNSASFLATHLLDIVVNAAKSGKVKVDALKDSIKGFSDKNVEDNSKIDWEHVQIDPSGTSMKCFFDGDSKKIIDKFMKEYESQMKDVKKEIEEADKKLHDDVKKAGVKIDDEKLDQNGLVVASVIDDESNEGKSGKELTKEVEKKIGQKDEAKDLMKQARESEKKLDEIEVDPKIEKMSDEELVKAVGDEENESGSEDEKDNKSVEKLVKEVDEKLTTKLGKDYKQSLLTGVYSREELQRMAKKNKLKGLDLSQMKANKVIGVRIDFFADESKDVVNEVVDDKAGFVVRKVDSKEKDEGIKKIYEIFSKVLKDAVGEQFEGEVISFLKHWQGKNDDGNFDSLFVFVGLKSGIGESIEESVLNEGIELTSVEIKQATDKLVDYCMKHPNGYSNAEEAFKNAGISNFIDKVMELGAKASKTGSSSNGAALVLHDKLCLLPFAAKNSVGTGVLSYAAKEITDDAASVESFAKYIAKNTTNEVGKQIIKASKVIKGQAADAAAAGIDGVTTHPDVPKGFMSLGNGKIVPSFNYQSLKRDINDLNEIFNDGQVDPNDLERFEKMGDKLTKYTQWAEEHKGNSDPHIQQRIALVKRLQTQYDNMILDHGDELNDAGAFNSPRVISDSDGIPKDQTKSVSKAAAVAENDEDAQKASSGWKKALGLDKAFTALGIARLAAKSTGIVLNHGKDVIDIAGRQAMKYKEDKNIIADLRITLQNGEGSKSKFEDTKFSVRLNVDDCKWHATCLDDRKMKFPQEKLIKIALDSEEGKKFKKYCLGRWKSIFAPEDERIAIVPFILKNSGKLGLGGEKLSKEFVNNIRKMSEKFGKIEAVLK